MLKIDLTGKKFGHLTVLYYEGQDAKRQSIWVCRCKCGKKVWRSQGSLSVGGPNTSCGCSRPNNKRVVNYAGQRRGSLVVTKTYKREHGKTYWLCRCDCGKEVWRSITNLSRNQTGSCGCSRGWRIKDPKDILRNLIYLDLKGRAKKHGRKMLLSKEQVFKLIDQPCVYCGLEKSNTKGMRGNRTRYHRKATYRYNGIDRIDSSGGYTEGNVVPCCRNCNEGKMKRTQQEYLENCKRVVAYHKKKARKWGK